MESQNGGLQRFEVLVDRAADVAVCGVEVSVGQAVTHPCDVAPGMSWLGVEQLGGDGLDRFADLDEADPDGIEDEPV